MIVSFGHIYKARISTDIGEDLYYPVTLKDKQKQLFDFFHKNHCLITSIKELKTRKNSIVKKYEIEFEDGQRGVAYDNIVELASMFADIDFQLLKVIK